MARKREDDDRDHDENERKENHKNNKKKYAAPMPDRKYAYHRDKEFAVLVTHNNEISKEQLQKFARSITSRLKPLSGVRVENMPEAFTFPGLTDEEIRQSKGHLSESEVGRVSKSFSIVKFELESAPKNPARLLRIVKQLNKQYSPDKQESIAGLTIEGTTVNWLTSVASQSGGTGGPGGRPFPYFGNRKNAPYVLDVKKQLKEANGGSIYGDGSDVDVVILDTAPCAQDLVAAYKEWPDHPLISTLLGPNGKLHLYPATYKELLRLGCTSLNDHDYKMTDHGLFIAGIIHSIVPKAEIHLIEVLNQYGVGDLISFVQGLLKIYTEKIYNRKRKLVINCSWMLEYPLDDLHCRHMRKIDDPDAEFENAVRTFTRNDQATGYLLDFLFDRFYGIGRQAIAAAGNDGRTEDANRTKARFPAALRSVTGTGALPKSLPRTGDQRNNYIPAGFSNLSEAPDRRGVVTKGVVTLGGEEGEGKGVLGLYIGDFPDCCRNESKWAWWSGTSFATPILTGAVASVLSRPGNRVTTTQQAIKRLYAPGAKIILDGQAGKQEDALPVTQS